MKRPEIIESPILARLARWKDERLKREMHQAVLESKQEMMDIRFRQLSARKTMERDPVSGDWFSV